MEQLMKVEIKKVNPRAEIPVRATDGSAGYDLKACLDEDIVLLAGECKLIPTGLAVHISDPSVMGMLVPRSKRGAKEGLVLGNLSGIIDSDYIGQWFVAAWNRNFNDPITIKDGDAIAQVIFVPVITPVLEEVEWFTESTARGDGGIAKSEDTIVRE
jgi:dUTP pyrophosphatase